MSFLQRNYRFFFMFVSSTTMLCLYVFAFCWVNIRKIMDAHDCNLWRAFLKCPVSGILILYTFVAAWFVGGLTAFHLYLIFTNQVLFSSLPLLLFVVPIGFYLELLSHVWHFCRQHMRISGTVMMGRWILITVGVLSILWTSSFLKFPVLGTTSGQRLQGIPLLCSPLQCHWALPWARKFPREALT